MENFELLYQSVILTSGTFHAFRTELVKNPTTQTPFHPFCVERKATLRVNRNVFDNWNVQKKICSFVECGFRALEQS